jgi:hypothetical protein
VPARVTKLLFVTACLWLFTLYGTVRSQVASSPTVDYADPSHLNDWLRHPVFGDPSFDNFQHAATNPVFRGLPQLEWPVNGFYFIDPVSGNHYLYVGDYARGYWGPGRAAARCILFRSTDGGGNWSRLPGPVLEGNTKSFDADSSGPGHLPDVSVVYFDHRYHMVYDWERIDHSDGGIAYAWANKPEGPFHRDPQPILREDDHANLAGRYSRPYAATLIRRKNDWLITGMMDDAPFGWAMFVITAKTPQGPWSKPVLVRNVESAYFHPPLMEGYPAFSDGQYIYAPVTSVAKNRDFQCIFKAPIDQADLPSAWSLDVHGSLWHSEDRENEYFGIWGQTFSGALDRSGALRVLFPSKDRNNIGTINTAIREWNAPVGHGFHLSAHTGPAFTMLRRTCDECTLETRFHLHGTARLLWDYSAPLGPDQPRSDASLHKLMFSRHSGLEMDARGWRVVRLDDAGSLMVLASGSIDGRRDWIVGTQRGAGKISVSIDGREVWTGNASVEEDGIGWLLEPDTYLSVSQFAITGRVRPVHRSYLFTEGWLDSAEDPVRWKEVSSTDFRYGLGAISQGSQAAAKWSVVGHRFILYSPKGPDYGAIRVSVDGHAGTIVNLQGKTAERSAPVWTGEADSGDYHAIVITPLTPLQTPLDSLDVSD